MTKLHHERLSDWPELMAPAFQFLLAVGGGNNEPLCEGLSHHNTKVHL